jgi:hypothetical protein
MFDNALPQKFFSILETLDIPSSYAWEYDALFVIALLITIMLSALPRWGIPFLGV